MAVAQSMAFSYHDFAEAMAYELPKSSSSDVSFTPKRKRQGSQSTCSAIWQVLFSTRDVIEDAHSTFIKEMDED